MTRHKTIKDFALDVPHGTFDLLNKYVDLVLKWNKTMNLIARSTESDIWHRHVFDSAQLVQHIPKTAIVFDIGSGAGFPGVVISLIQGNKVILAEKDARKCAFLHQAKVVTSANVEIKHAAVEATSFVGADIITCRAFAPLAEILKLTHKAVSPHAKLVLLKGAGYKQELEDVKTKGWAFKYEAMPSLTDTSAAILILSDVHPPLNLR